MAQMIAMRKTLDERARKKALDAIFNRFDFNQNGAVQSRRSGNIYVFRVGIFSGKIFIKDFMEELEMQDIKVTEDEMKALAQFADSDGQVIQRATVKTLQQHKVASICLQLNKVLAFNEFICNFNTW